MVHTNTKALYKKSKEEMVDTYAHKYPLVVAVLLSITSSSSSSLAPAMHPGFGAILRSRSLERFEPKVLEDGDGMHVIADLPRTGLDSVLRVAAQNVGLKEVYAGKCLVPPPGVPAEFQHDQVIRFEDPLTGSDVSVWWRPLFGDKEHKDSKGLVIDGIFSRRIFKWDKTAQSTAPWTKLHVHGAVDRAQTPWTALLVDESKQFTTNAASPFAWWRAMIRGASAPHLEASTVCNLISDVEAAFKEAVKL